MSKKRHPYDQRRLIITLSKFQQAKIDELIKDLDSELTGINDLNKYLINNQFNTIKMIKNFKELCDIKSKEAYNEISFDELYVLGLLITLTFENKLKDLKLLTEKNYIYISPLIKSLIQKDYILKKRNEIDERVIFLSIKDDKLSKVKKLFDECYNQIIKE